MPLFVMFFLTKIEKYLVLFPNTKKTFKFVSYSWPVQLNARLAQQDVAEVWEDQQLTPKWFLNQWAEEQRAF